jgi:hypothetical protein
MREDIKLMNPNIKQLIKREGLVLLWLAGVCLGIPFLLFLLSPIFPHPQPSNYDDMRGLGGLAFAWLAMGFLVIIYGYPTYLIIRFIIWRIHNNKRIK